MKKTCFSPKIKKLIFLMLFFLMNNRLSAATTVNDANTALIPDFVQEHQALLWILGALIFILILMILTKSNEPLSE